MAESAGVRRTGDPADHYFLVLHAVRLKGHAQPEAIAELTRLAAPEIEGHLADAMDRGHVQKREGRLTGFYLTPEGREHHAVGIREEARRFGIRDSIDTAYRRFLSINGELLATCTAWQMTSETELNDHADPAYDKGVIDRLRAVHQAVEPICVLLSEALDRFDTYEPRLAYALEQVENGDVSWFTSPMIESYHTVWFELHEDLLVTLELERSSEGA